MAMGKTIDPLVGQVLCKFHYKKCQLADLKLITMSFYGDMQTKRPTRTYALQQFLF